MQAERIDPPRIERMQAMPVFGAVSARAIEDLLTPLRVRQVAAGGYFFRQGEDACSMYVLETGTVEVRKRWQGHDYLLRTLGAGDVFGEMALMDPSPRNASVRAASDCSAIEVSPDDLLRLFEHDPEQFALIQMNLGREVCRRLRATDEQLFRATVGEGPATVDSVFHAL
jgi:CRP/FNR family transcriptional regulator, cyclic AMP receptor protein